MAKKATMCLTLIKFFYFLEINKTNSLIGIVGFLKKIQFIVDSYFN